MVPNDYREPGRRGGKGLLNERNLTAVLPVSLAPKGPTFIQVREPFQKCPWGLRAHLVRLSLFMEHPGINGRGNEVIGCSDGVDVTSEVQIKL